MKKKVTQITDQGEQMTYRELRGRSKKADRARREFQKRPELEGQIRSMLDAGEIKPDIARKLRTSNLVVEAIQEGLGTKDLEPKFGWTAEEGKSKLRPPKRPKQKIRGVGKAKGQIDGGGLQPSGRGQSDPKLIVKGSGSAAKAQVAR